MATMPPLLSPEDIAKRLAVIFPKGVPAREHILKPSTSRSVFAALYVGAVAPRHTTESPLTQDEEGDTRWLAPRHVYRMTDAASIETDAAARTEFYRKVPKSGPNSWYADNSRETARDEGIRQGLIPLSAMLQKVYRATNSMEGSYALQPQFAALLNPALVGPALEAQIAVWQETYLTPAALMRANLAQVVTGLNTIVNLPQGGSTTLPFGSSPGLTQAVVEEFSKRFLFKPVAVWISDSQVKVTDSGLVARLKIPINKEKLLPDVILADIGEASIKLVLVEVVSTDGAVTEKRRVDFLKSMETTGLDENDILFVTAYDDRQSRPVSRSMRELAWNSFAWFRSEPDHLVQMHGGKPRKLKTLI